MRHKITPLFFLLAALPLTACRSNTTYKFPTDEHAFVARDADDEDTKIFRESYTNFVHDNAERLSKNNKNYAFPILSAYQTNLTVLTASESDTYGQVAKILRTDAPDEYSLVQGFNSLIAPYATDPDSPLRFGSSLWMVWPIPLEESFKEDMAARLGCDVLKLGSTGITAQRALQRWLDRFDPQSEAPEFDRTSPIVSFGATAATLDVQFAKAEVDGNVFWVGFASDPRLKLVAWAQNTEFQFPRNEWKESLFSALAPTPSKSSATIHEIRTSTDFAPLVKEDGAGQLLTGPNDLRNMSVEVIPAGDRIGIPIMRQYSTLILNITGENPFTQPIGFALYDTKTELPLMIGKHTP